MVIIFVTIQFYCLDTWNDLQKCTGVQTVEVQMMEYATLTSNSQGTSTGASKGRVGNKGNLTLENFKAYMMQCTRAMSFFARI